MLRSMTALLAFATLPNCVENRNLVPFTRAYIGDYGSDSKITIVGVIDTTGINFYSLFENDDHRSGNHCMSLILDRDGQAAAKRLSGQRVQVSGNAIPMVELEEAMPNKYGEINGREWSGTRCGGHIAIYVTSWQELE